MQPIDCILGMTSNHWHSVDAHENHIEIAFEQSIIVCDESHTHYWHRVLCWHYCLHPGVLLPLNFWSTAFYTIWGRKDVAPLHSHAFGRQLTACTSFHLFFANLARLPYHSLSGSFSWLSITYPKQFQISQPCTPSLWGELCLWIYGWMQHNGSHSDRSVMCIDRCSYDTYGITQLNFCAPCDTNIAFALSHNSDFQKETERVGRFTVLFGF